VPPGVVTVHCAGPATPAGTRVLIFVDDKIVKEAFTPRSCTFDAPSRFLPVSVISVPARPGPSPETCS
jgi:hypothetical protein